MTILAGAKPFEQPFMFVSQVEGRPWETAVLLETSLSCDRIKIARTASLPEPQVALRCKWRIDRGLNAGDRGRALASSTNESNEGISSAANLWIVPAFLTRTGGRGMTEQTVAGARRCRIGSTSMTAAGLLCVLVVYCLFSYWQLRIIATTQYDVRRASATLSAASQVLADLQDAETGQRGYLLTGQPRYLEPYHAALATLHDDRQRLQQALEDQPQVAQRLPELDRQIDTKLSELADTVRIARDDGLEAARRIVEGHRGLHAMDAIRDTLGAIAQVEADRRDALRNEADVSMKYAISSLVIATVFSCAIVVIGFYVVQREIAARQAMAEALQSADRNKNDFLALLGHELRNPLAAIRNAADVLDLADALPELAEEMRVIIRRQATVMARLVDDLLDTSRIAHGKIELRKKRFDLCALLERTAADIRSATQGTEVIIAVDAPEHAIWINGDETRLSQAVGNLLYNAIKFSRRGGRVFVALRTRSSSRRAVLSIADQGIGIDRDTLQHIFEPFAQGRANGDRSRGGLGLGLPLTKGLVRLHGGKLLAHSDGPGRGATFTIVLPTDERGAATPEIVPPAPASAGRCRILVIDDRRDASYPLQRILERSGHEVHVACDASSGIHLAHKLEPDIVLCDIGLPGAQNGYDVAREIRKRYGDSSPHLVALTAYGDEQARRMALAAGFDRHVIKPISLTEIRTILASVPCRAADDAPAMRE